MTVLNMRVHLIFNRYIGQIGISISYRTIDLSSAFNDKYQTMHQVLILALILIPTTCCAAAFDGIADQPRHLATPQTFLLVAFVFALGAALRVVRANARPRRAPTLSSVPPGA